MARKKVNSEPQEDPMEGVDMPVGDMTDDGTGMAPDQPMEGDGAAPITDEGMAEGTAFGDFPSADEVPFESPPEGDVSSVDGAPPEADTTEESSAGDGDPAMEDNEYNSFLQAMGEGDVQPVIPPEASPLLLDDAGVGFEQDMQSAQSEGEGPVQDEPAQEASTRTINRRPAPQRERERVLTIDPRAEVQTPEDLEDLVWHELQNANRTRHILTGQLDSVGRTQNGMDVAVVLYKGVQVLIPLKEMGVHTGQVPSGPEYTVWVNQVTRILHARQNSDIDFVVRGIDEEGRKVVGSRRDAMHRKRRRFYMDTDELGRHMIEEGRTVQARVVAVSEKVIRVEVFGVECNVSVRGSSRMWMGNAREDHYVGELILVRVQKIDRINADRITIQVDASSVFGEKGDNLSQCQPQCRYVGQVTDVRKGVVFVRLNIGVNAIAHTCYDMRLPGKKDTVSFSVTRLDEKRGVAIGIITRIIKQNL